MSYFLLATVMTGNVMDILEIEAGVQVDIMNIISLDGQFNQECMDTNKDYLSKYYCHIKYNAR